MNAHTRQFHDTAAVREHVPLLVGLMGPSGSGKTFSALRLGHGIQRVSGGDIFVVDTESKRALHYADQFKFRHVPFSEPFGSLDYLAALQYCVGKGAGVVVVDSMSHEHIGLGGYLLTQEAELDRMAGEDLAKRERVKMAAWIKPAKLRQQFINGLLQLNCNFIFCFRAKEKIKPSPGKQPIEMGFMPIAGEELLFEMTMNCLLLPKAGGIPTWRSDHVGERLMMKCPQQFAPLFEDERRVLDESVGQALAEWARGGSTSGAARDVGAEAEAAARGGKEAFVAYWQRLGRADRDALKPRIAEFQRLAAEADAADADPFADKTDPAAHPSAAATAGSPPSQPEDGEADAASASPSDEIPPAKAAILDTLRAAAVRGRSKLKLARGKLSVAEMEMLTDGDWAGLDRAARQADGVGG